ncbi:MAG: hypothetical protein JWQ69_3990 [Pseudomonas sp.]|nr:hypothetical protein [Pseudomonas sp.]
MNNAHHGELDMTSHSKQQKPAKTRENVGDVGETNKRLNQQGEKPRPGTPPDPKDRPSN